MYFSEITHLEAALLTLAGDLCICLIRKRKNVLEKIIAYRRLHTVLHGQRETNPVMLFMSCYS